MKVNQIENKHINEKEPQRKFSRKSYAPKKTYHHQMKMKSMTVRQKEFYLSAPLFFFPFRVGFFPHCDPCIQTCEVRYVAPRGRSQQLVDWPLETGRDVRVETCVSGTGMYFPKSQVLLRNQSLRSPGRVKYLMEVTLASETTVISSS
jgi:hypothetical protein